MRSLFLLRGAPASGKSTWVKENGFESYTLSTDDIRLMYQSPELKVDGSECISQKNDGKVWDTLFDMLEIRMENGELIIVDATHYKAPLINKYKDLVDKYRYRVYVVNFTDITEEELLKRNASRGFRKVPEEIIQKMLVSLKDDSEIRSGYNILKPDEARDLINSPLKPVIIDKKKVVVFGDIHGCMEPIKKYFDEHPFNDDTCYIFSGDYIDRGIQNKEVLEFLLSIYKNKNVILLEGNHEKWLRIYADKNYDINKYIGKTEGYKDFYATKVINELKQASNEISKQINENLSSIELILKTLEDERKVTPETKDIYFEFEKINADDKLKELFDKNQKCEANLKKIQDLTFAIKKEEKSTNDCIDDIKDSFSEITGRDLPFEIFGTIKHELKLDVEKQKNPIKSLEFIKYTYQQIKGIDKSDLRQLCRKFSQMSYFTFNGKEYIVTHAGVPVMPTLKMPTGDIVKGVGKYEDGRACDESFIKNNEKIGKKIISIHGHRNIFKDPCKMNDGLTYNLESKIEHGGYLSIVEIDNNGENVVQIENTTYDKTQNNEKKKMTDLELLKSMYKSSLINVKILKDDVISLNFTRDAFYDSKWNEQTCTARGLFVNKKTGDVVARSFTKFFNYNEVDATKSDNLERIFKYPVVGYKKENGFLGLITKYKGEIKFYTKSSDDGDYVKWFKKIFYEKTGLSENDLKSKIRDGYTYIFECVDHINDPHIIKYDEDNVFLLEIMKNQMEEHHLSYDELCTEAKNLNVKVKEKALVFNNWEEFNNWKTKFRSNKTKWDCRHEGYVFEDVNGFRVKFKSSFYIFWKQMRTVKEILQRGAANQKIYKTKEEVEVVKLLESIDKDKLKDMSIIDVEDKYYGGK